MTDKKKLILHADDGGLCRSVNRAIMTALTEGMVTSTSLMVPCPAFDEIAAFFIMNPQFEVGVHLTLTCEYPHHPWGPVSDPEIVPSLVNADGYFWQAAEFPQHANPEDVQTEMRAQVERFMERGLKPCHFDIHQGSVFNNLQLLTIYIKLGLEYQIPVMVIKPTEATVEMIAERGLKINSKIIESLMNLGLPFLDFLFLPENSTDNLEARKQLYRNALEICPVGVSQFIVHPGYDDEELRQLTVHSRNRFFDLQVVTDPEFKRFIAEAGIQLIGWKDLPIEKV